MIKDLPNAREVECAIISAIILTPNSIYNCIQLLNEECFYYHKNKILWTTLLAIHKTGKTIDTVNVFGKYIKETYKNICNEKKGLVLKETSEIIEDAEKA